MYNDDKPLRKFNVDTPQSSPETPRESQALRSSASAASRLPQQTAGKKLQSSFTGTSSAFCGNMGIFRSSFVFSLGTFAGVYVAQNYSIPNLKTFTTTGLIVAKQLETQYRKPPKDENQ